MASFLTTLLTSITLLIVLMFPFAVNAAPPDWYIQRSLVINSFADIGYGSGRTPIEARANAIAELSQLSSVDIRSSARQHITDNGKSAIREQMVSVTTASTLKAADLFVHAATQVDGQWYVAVSRNQQPPEQLLRSEMDRLSIDTCQHQVRPHFLSDSTLYKRLKLALGCESNALPVYFNGRWALSLFGVTIPLGISDLQSLFSNSSTARLTVFNTVNRLNSGDSYQIDVTLKPLDVLQLAVFSITSKGEVLFLDGPIRIARPTTLRFPLDRALTFRAIAGPTHFSSTDLTVAVACKDANRFNAYINSSRRLPSTDSFSNFISEFAFDNSCDLASATLVISV